MMIDKMKVYENGLEVLNALAPFYQEISVAKIREADALGSWFVLLQSAGVDPEPITGAQLAEVMPYIAPQNQRERLDAAIDAGFLATAGNDGYRLTELGRSVLAGFFDTAHAAIATAPVLPTSEMETLTALLQRIVGATEALPYPVRKPNLERSRWTDTGLDSSLTARVDQYLTDLQVFRDDAHITAWQAYDVNGRTWEAFTLLWRNEARTAAELAEKLSGRGFSEEAYAAALETLVEKGWTFEGETGWQPTDTGLKIRKAAETETDRLFFAGWDALDEAETGNLNDLLAQLAIQLKEAAPVAEPA